MNTEDTIIAMHAEGKGATEIARELGMPRQTVQSIINKKVCQCGQIFYSVTFSHCTHCLMLKRVNNFKK